VLGALAVLIVPAAALASRYNGSLTLLKALYFSVPAALVLGALALVAVRRARNQQARSVFQRGSKLARLGRFLAWAGVYIGCTGAVALAVYATLRSTQ